MASAGTHRIAERYARALFQLADEKGKLEAVESDLRAIVQAVKESEELQSFIENPLLSRKLKAKTFDALLAKMNAVDLSRDFIMQLAENRRLAVLEAIANVFEKWMMERRSQLVMDVRTAKPLSSRQQSDLVKALSAASGREAKLNITEDPSLIGGIVILAEGKMADYSVKGLLSRLKTTLKAA